MKNAAATTRFAEEAGARRRPRAGSLAGVLFAVFQNDSQANGGVESVTQLIEGIEETTRIVVTNAETPVTERWRRAGAETFLWRLPHRPGQGWRAGGATGWLRRLWSLVVTNWQTWRLLRRQGLAAVHCNDPAPFWHVAVGARLAGVPLLWNLRDTKSREEGLNVARYRRRFRWCARVFVLSREMKAFYEPAARLENGALRPPLDFVYSVVDFSRMKPLAAPERLALRRQLGVADEVFAVGFIATCNDKKNQFDYLKHAAPRLRELCPAAHSFFVGDFDPERAPYARRCAGAARELELGDRARFVGFCAEVERWYQACDVVVIPTRKEGLARCMIEALACGTPVVSFAVSSAREILEEHHCGRVVPQGDYEQLCQALAEFAKDAKLRTECAARGPEVARRLFSREACLEKYRNLLGALAAEDAAAPTCLEPAIQP